MTRILSLVLALGLVGCIEDRPEAEQQAADRQAREQRAAEQRAAEQEDLPNDVRRAADLARQVDANPSTDLETLLSSEQMTPEDLDELLYDIASDPEKTRQYMQARRAAPAGVQTTERPEGDRMQ